MPNNNGYDNTNTGVFSKNDRKTSPNHPDVKGTIEVQCPHCQATTPMWLDGWQKQRKSDGGLFYSLSLKVKDQQQQGQGQGQGQRYQAPPQGYQQAPPQPRQAPRQAPNGYPPQGYPPQGYQQAPQGYPPQVPNGYPTPNGYPPQGYQQAPQQQRQAPPQGPHNDGMDDEIPF